MVKKKNANGNLPAYSIRLGALRGAVWANSANGNTYYTASLVRRYKDGDDYKETATFSGVADCLGVIEIARKCIDFMHGADEQADQEASEQGGVSHE
jgi:hypothetical protein